MLALMGTLLVGVTLWALRSIDECIPHTRRAEITVLGTSVIGGAHSDLPGISHCSLRLKKKRMEAGTTSTVFEMARRASAAHDGSDRLLAALEANSRVIAFRLNAETGH